MNSTDKSGLTSLLEDPINTEPIKQFDGFFDLLDHHTKNWHKDRENKKIHKENFFADWSDNKVKDKSLKIRSQIIEKESRWALLIDDNNRLIFDDLGFDEIFFEFCTFECHLNFEYININDKFTFFNNTFKHTLLIYECKFNNTFFFHEHNTFNNTVRIIQCHFNDEFVSYGNLFKEDCKILTCKFKSLYFSNSIFKKDVFFFGSTFHENADFREVKFFNQANFQDVTFKSDVNFTTLNQTARCAITLCKSLPEIYKDDSLIPTYIKKIAEKYKFKEIKDNEIICDKEMFEINDSKSKYTLIYKCETKLIFLNTLFGGRTAFHDSENIKSTDLYLAQFKNSFSYSTYNENLVDFSKALFEKIPQIKIPSHWKDSTEANEDAFRFIKNLFKNDNDFEQEAIYFKKEMDSKYKKLTWRSDPIHKSFFWLFKKCSDYGYSYIRPLLCLGGITLACYSFALFKDPTTHQVNSELIYDMLNTMFPFLKLNISVDETWYKVVIKLLSYPLLFLTLLGFRNKFKLK